MNYKYTSIDEILERLHMNHPFIDNNFEWSDALEWVGNLIKLMDIPYHMEQKRCSITIEDFKGELPIDLFQVEMFKDKESGVIMKYTGDPFFKHLHCSDSACLNCSCPDDRYRYQLNNNYIFTGMETGTIEIAYLAIPLDDKNFPLIPDQEAFKKAVEWEIAMKVAYKEWITDKLSGDKFRYIEQQRNWYVAKAMNKPKTPDLGRMEAIKNFTLRLIPKINVLDDRFQFNQEKKFNQNTNNFSQGSKL